LYVEHHNGWQQCEKRYKWSEKGKKSTIGELEGRGQRKKKTDCRS